ncbi:SGNH/GDSL hydrolase family protein [Edaphobacter bradus]|uniref:hypothetical protein n=1 Tax=Edaphobacter bradus TaxID=2259016 RepID=UPI0021E0508C|nr:hypothetical protein [Edaphobacter bradus]
MAEQHIIDAIANGQKSADAVLARRKIARANRAAAIAKHTSPIRFNVQMSGFAQPAVGFVDTAHQTTGFLIAAGDSWFDYFDRDILEQLKEHYGYTVRSAAHAGDRIEAMVEHDSQLYKLQECLEEVLDQGAVPQAVLISGGGNDIAGKEFGMLLNSKDSVIAGWNDEMIDGLINQRLKAAYTAMLSGVNQLCKSSSLGKVLPVLIHGYDYPVPDGRGVLGLWPLPGPWLQPGFNEKRFGDLQQNTDAMHDLIDRFNAMLQTLPQLADFANVRHVDLRNTLSTKLADDAYQQVWGNELHPNENGFPLIADKFATALSNL